MSSFRDSRDGGGDRVAIRSCRPIATARRSGFPGGGAALMGRFGAARRVGTTRGGVEGERSRFSLALACLVVLSTLASTRESMGLQGDGASGGVRVTEFVGRTMGTTYSVKVADPPEWDGDPHFEIESVLRAVNDEMSTYLESSDLSRFNRSPADTWVGVSPNVVMVVDAARSVSEVTDGVFDVTIGPLVDLWGFGAGSDGRNRPGEDQVRDALTRIGYRHLETRVDPPAMRKSIDDLQVDLSAIAKGHGVDRVVEHLGALGAANVFVEIGGEVRATGMVGDRPWRVGIQQPDAGSDRLLAAVSLENRAMATSGDYRNRYVEGDEIYSHTLDPRTGRPARNRLASVTVVADDCMMADAWATTIMAVGGEAGRDLAEAQDLDVLFVSRIPEGGYEVWGRGSLEATSVEASKALAGILSKANGAEADREASTFLTDLVPVVVVTAVAFAILLTVMAVGVLFGRPAISGSCGGLNARTGKAGENCGTCGTPTEGCRELREKLAEAGVGRERDDSFGAH